MNKNESYLMIALLAVIAWELYSPSVASACNQGNSSATIGPTTASPWIQQLSANTFGEDYFTPQCGVFGNCQ